MIFIEFIQKHLNIDIKVLLSFIVLFSLSGISTLPAYSQVLSGTAQDPTYSFAQGTPTSSETTFSDIPEIPENSGYRVYCRVSHLSYNNPFSQSSQNGRAHLHTFSGNTETNSSSTYSTISTRGNSSCTGGIGGAYWKPTLLDQRNEAVIPSLITLSFKSHEGKDQLRNIPNGLHLEAKNSNLGCSSRSAINFECTRQQKNNDGTLMMVLYFPNCLSVDLDGRPILNSYNGNHSLFDYASCPDSHPYRIPIIKMTYFYPTEYEQDWKLSTDITKDGTNLPQGSSQRGGIITALTESHQNDITQCILQSQNCELWSNDDLEEISADGTTIYSNVQHIGDTTPIGSVEPYLTLTKSTEERKDEIPKKLISPVDETRQIVEQTSNIQQIEDAPQYIANHPVLSKHPEIISYIEEGLPIEEITKKILEDGNTSELDLLVIQLLNTLKILFSSTSYDGFGSL